MSDQNAATQEGEQQIADSSVAETGTQDQAAQPSVNWEERAKEHQSWGTRLAQENAELRAETELVKALRSEDPEEYNEALRKLGFNVPEEQQQDYQQQAELDPELRARLAKVDELDQWRQSLTTEHQQQESYSSYREDVDPQLTKLGVPEAFIESVADIAYTELPAIQTPQGPMPDLEGAVQRFKDVAAMFAEVPDVQHTAVEAWRKGKRAPHTSPVGIAGTQTPNLDDRDTRRAWMAEQLMANEQQ